MAAIVAGARVSLMTPALRSGENPRAGDEVATLGAVPR